MEGTFGSHLPWPKFYLLLRRYIWQLVPITKVIIYEKNWELDKLWKFPKDCFILKHDLRAGSWLENIEGAQLNIL